MDTTLPTLAAPPTSDPQPTWVWVVVGGIFLVGIAVGVVAPFLESLKNRKVPLEQQKENLLHDLRTGHVHTRGYVRLNPSTYPGLSGAAAEEIAAEAGFFRQTAGAKGNWLFHPEQMPEGPVDTGDPKGTISAGDASTGARRSEGRKAGGILLLMVGIGAGLAHVTNWVNGNMLEWIDYGDGVTLAVTHVLNVLALVWGFRLLFGKPKKR
ncbi:hypothetical protein [Streptomyces sp. HNM0574]|uniref:hypothetical protein n=1 Tax=Streptomyces sp. HNM0574 TaxID=2714954 RepID=UPI00146C10BB|nr:hypothetical protein [Streptomyces sp. HNM0574]NLU66046.1 hypothetical protein [Streptomyces sp. HNM0574]